MVAKAVVNGEFRVLSTELVGSWSRYKVSKCESRFGAIEYQVSDAEKLTPDGHPEIIRQAAIREEALAGLNLNEEGDLNQD